MIVEINGVNVSESPLCICNCAELDLQGPYIGYIYKKESQGYYLEILEHGNLIDSGHFDSYEEAEEAVQEAIRSLVEDDDI